VRVGHGRQIESVDRAAELLRKMESLVEGLRSSLVNSILQEELIPLDGGALLETMAQIGELSSELRGSLAELAESAGLTSARSRLRHYLLDRPGEVVGTYALSGVAGIQEAPRRIRELRNDEALPITVGPAGGLHPGQYRLERAGAGEPAVKRWDLLSRCRGTTGSQRDRCLALLQALHPHIVDAEELAYVAGGEGWLLSVNELASEGWDIVTAATDLQMSESQYRLDSLTRRPPRRMNDGA